MIVRLAIVGALMFGPRCATAAEGGYQAAPETVAPRPKRAINAPAPLSKELTPPVDKSTLAAGTTPEHRLLAEKLAERDRIQQEIDALSEKLQAAEQILIDVEMLELNITKMRNQGFELNATGTTPADARLVKLIEELRKHGLARPLFSPRVVTVSGRQASVFVGTESPVPTAGSIQTVEYVEYGQRVDLLPTALGNNKVRIDLRAKVSTGGPRPETVRIDGERAPTIDAVQCDTTVETAFGETLMLQGMRSQRVKSVQQAGRVVEEVDDIETVILLTADKVGAERQH